MSLACFLRDSGLPALFGTFAVMGRASTLAFLAMPQPSRRLSYLSASFVLIPPRLPATDAVMRRPSLYTRTRKTRARVGLPIKVMRRSGVDDIGLFRKGNDSIVPPQRLKPPVDNRFRPVVHTYAYGHG